MDYTADELIKKVKRYANIPSSQPNWDDTDILNFLTEELQSVVAPMVYASREDFTLHYSDVAIPAVGSYVMIPTRAAGGVIREIHIVDSDGNVLENLTRLMPSSFGTNWRNVASGLLERTGTFKLLGNKIYVSTTNTGTLRIYFYTRPSELVKSTDVALITDITGLNVTVSSMPSAMASLTAVDCVQGTPQFEVISISSTVSIVSNVATFTAVPTGLAVGDYLTVPGQSTVINLPLELHELVVQGAVVKILEAARDQAGLTIALGRYKQLLDGAKGLIEPRVPGEPKIIDTSKGLI